MINYDKEKRDYVVFSKIIMTALREVYGINFLKIGINKKNPTKLVYFYEDTQQIRELVRELSKKLR